MTDQNAKLSEKNIVTMRTKYQIPYCLDFDLKLFFVQCFSHVVTAIVQELRYDSREILIKKLFMMNHLTNDNC